ncbi:LacI family DNA-binding transcriptional regulator [Streptomyces longwoodensis]|uniref:LacI family DNA-binding transcriptional regulator n=1 Tax=Streptomyces longwoodensis TaxID=68231 RepID=UPI0034061FEE
MTGRTTLRQVAERAGVAIGTASAVFADKSWVSEQVRTAVRAAAEELGYQPRPRRPEHGDVTDLGFLATVDETFSVANPYFARVLHGAQQACAERGIALHYEVVDPDSGRLPLCVQRRQVSGVLVLGHDIDRAYLERVVERRVPCVLLEHAPVDLPVDHVRHDDERGGHLAGRHLLALPGTPRTPGLITGEAKVSPVGDRTRGFRRALEEAGVTLDPAHVRSGTLDVASGMRCMNELLALPDPPSAVFCANDETAFGALEAVRARGLRVPEDIAVMGYDDVPQAEHTDPPLTTIATGKELIGTQAVWHLLERLRHPDLVTRDTRLGVRLVERASTTGTASS